MAHTEYVIHRALGLRGKGFSDYPVEDYADFFINWSTVPFTLFWLLDTYFDTDEGMFLFTIVGYTHEWLIVRVERNVIEDNSNG